MVHIVGRNKTVAGKNTMMANLNKSAAKNGMIPLNIVVRETSGSIDLSTKTFMPIGGVI